MAQVMFKKGLLASMPATGKNADTLYFATDVGVLYLGDTRISDIVVASAEPTLATVLPNRVIVYNNKLYFRGKNESNADALIVVDPGKIVADIAAASAAAATAQGEVDTLEGQVGTVPEGKTVVGMIGDLETKVGTVPEGKTVVGMIDEAVGALDVEAVTAGTGEVISEVSETDGKISVTKKTLSAEDIPTLTTAKLSDFGTEMAKKQDVVAFEGAYDKETNKAATMADVNDAVAGLQGAMHYCGDSSTDPMGESGPTVEGYNKAWVAGDVVTYQTEEFLYTGSAWRPYGKEGDYAIKGSIKNSDIAADAAIAQSKISGLTDALAGKADNDDLHSHTNKAELDKIADGDKAKWDEAATKAGTAVQSVATGTNNGTITVDSAEVAVKGLDSAAYKKETDFDAAGKAVEEAGKVLGAASDDKTKMTVYGVKAYADSLIESGLGWGTF